MDGRQKASKIDCGQSTTGQRETQGRDCVQSQTERNKKEEDAATSNTHMVTGQFAFYDKSTHQTTDATTAITPYDRRTIDDHSHDHCSSKEQRQYSISSRTEKRTRTRHRIDIRCHPENARSLCNDDSVEELLNGTEGSR